MSQIEKEKLAQKFLETLYAQFKKNKNVLTSAQYNILERARKSGLNMQGAVHSLQAVNIVKKEGYPGNINYSWIEKAPNSTLVKKFLTAIKEHQDHRSEIDRQRREKAAGGKTKSKVVVNKSTEIVPVSTDNPKVNSIFNAMEKIYNLMQGGAWISAKHILFKDLAEKNGVAAPTALSLGMQRAKIIEREGGGTGIMYRWIGNSPTSFDAERVYREMKEYFKEKNIRWRDGVREKKNNNKAKEVIKPNTITVKKTPAPKSQLMIARAKRLMELGEKDFAYQLLDELL